MSLNGPLVLLAAGGTGGHLIPARVMAENLEKRGFKIAFVTDERGKKQLSAHYPEQSVFVLASGGLVGKSLAQRLRGTLKLLHGIFQGSRLLRAQRPAAIVGFGGYASVPVCLPPLLAKKKNGPAVIIHEGNRIMGTANKFLAGLGASVALSFPLKKAPKFRTPPVLTGMPIRPEIEALGKSSIKSSDQDVLTLLIWGGSLGAKVFSAELPNVLAGLPENCRRKLRLIQQASAEEAERLKAFYKTAGIALLETAPYFEDVVSCLKKADLVIGRAGGSSVAELIAAHKPAVFVPLPVAANDEQGENAAQIADGGGGWIVRQAALKDGTLARLLKDLIQSPQRLHEARQALKRLHSSCAAEKLGDLILARIHQTRPTGEQP